MGFIPPLMKTPSKGASQQHPTSQTHKHIANRPEVIGGIPLWLASRARKALTTQADKPDAAATLREIADHVAASDTELRALRAEVDRLRCALHARLAGDTERATADMSARLFYHVCRLQTKLTKTERALTETQNLLTVLQRERDGFKQDVVMISVAFLGLLVLFVEYANSPGRDLFAAIHGVAF